MLAADSLAGWFLDNPFFLALVVFTVSAVVVAFVKGRALDRCLKSFRGSPVRIETFGRPPIYGTLKVGRDAVEIEFPAERERAVSRLVYRSEFAGLKAVVRALGDLDAAAEHRRARALRLVRRPPVWRRAARWARNALNTVQDAVQDSVRLSLGRLKAEAQGLQQADGALGRAGAELTGAILARYERILEDLRGRRVVVQLALPGGRDESVVGVLREYTPEFLEVWDVEYPVAAGVPVGGRDESGISAVPSDLGLRVRNASEKTVRIERVRRPDGVEELGGGLVGPGEVIEVSVKGKTAGATLECGFLSPCDLILPRPAAVVRHRARDE